MPRKGNAITFIPSGNSTTGPLLPESMIPIEVRREVEEVYAALKVNIGRMRVEYDTADELKEFKRQVQSYCATRPKTVDEVRAQFAEVDWAKLEMEPFDVNTITTAGPIRFRQSPSKSLPDTAMDFRITDLETDNEAKTRKVREATAKANGATPAPVADNAQGDTTPVADNAAQDQTKPSPKPKATAARK